MALPGVKKTLLIGGFNPIYNWFLSPPHTKKNNPYLCVFMGTLLMVVISPHLKLFFLGPPCKDEWSTTMLPFNSKSSPKVQLCARQSMLPKKWRYVVICIIWVSTQK